MNASHDGVRIDSQGRVVVVGDIDVLTAASIDTVLQRAESSLSHSAQLVIDVARVEFIDSSGLRVLLAASRRNDRLGRRVMLRSPGSSVLRLLAITGTLSMFALDPPVEGAATAP